jgi:hypothetical protein
MQNQFGHILQTIRGVEKNMPEIAEPGLAFFIGTFPEREAS